MEEPHVPTVLKVEEDIDIGDEIPMYDYPPVEIERDAPSPVRSSNSSSSSSGTDSSSGKGCSFLRFVVQFYSFLYFEEGF